MWNNFESFSKDIVGKKIGVVGYGVSNRPLVQALVENGAVVTVFDNKSASYYIEKENISLREDITFSFGENCLDTDETFYAVFRSPSMRPDNEFLTKQKNKGAYITSEIEEFVKFCPCRLIGITGSDGKTTTTSIVGELLNKEGLTVFIGGNIGTPLFSKLNEITEADIVVLELSSFQLMNFQGRIHYVGITNITPNHLDYHTDMKEYVEAKSNIFKNQTECDTIVINLECELSKKLLQNTVSNINFISTTEACDGELYDNKLLINNELICEADELNIKGIHNIQNFLMACVLTESFVSIETMRYVAKNFKGVSHRCEFVSEIDGISFYNDSIASTPTRTIAGLKTFKEKVILIAGGYDKNIDYEPLATLGSSKIKKLILMGDTKYKIQKEFEKLDENTRQHIEVVIVDDLEEAIIESVTSSKEGDNVILSPASASFDMFKNFEERGNEFKKIVNNIY